MASRAEIFSHHYGRGSSFPPRSPGVTRVYNMAFCPYGHRVLLAAEAKKIPIEIINIDLNNSPQGLKFSGVPVLENDEGLIKESLEICDYLDSLKPNEPSIKSNAEDKKWANKFYDVVQVIFPLFFRVFDSESATPLLNKLTAELRVFDKEIESRGSKYFAGDDHPGFLDFTIWPFIERLPILKHLFPGAIDFEKAKGSIPHLERWRLDMEAHPSIKVAYLDTMQHLKYIQNRRDVSQGIGSSIDYDFVL